MPNFHDHINKRIIREKWCKPLLHHIKTSLGYRLIYLGLPGSEALDILTWVEYLDSIIAFQCRRYGEPSKPSQPKDEIYKLYKILNDLEKSHVIRKFSLFDGYIEEVVLSGRDNSGNDFSQKDVVTIYNLDFCNPLTVPMEIIDKNGEVSKYYKLEVIRRLLEIQRDLSTEKPKKFIMFLTVHSKFWESEAKKLIGTVDSSYRLYMQNVKKLKLNWEENNIRLLKLYVYYTLKKHFIDCNFIPDFLPPIYYQGYGESWLINFTIIGTYHENVSKYLFKEDAEKFLKSKFLLANKKDIVCLDSANIDEFPTETDSVKLFCDINSYEKFWKRR